MKPSAVMNNRELSWLSFNERILQEARDHTTPLMQRLRFLGIFSSNQDEFIKVRVASLVRLTRSKSKIKPMLMGGLKPEEALQRVVVAHGAPRQGPASSRSRALAACASAPQASGSSSGRR